MKTARFNDPITRGELLQMAIAGLGASMLLTVLQKYWFDIKLGINDLVDKIKGEGK